MHLQLSSKGMLANSRLAIRNTPWCLSEYFQYSQDLFNKHSSTDDVDAEIENCKI